MTSMLIIHADGQADPIRLEPEEFLSYAEYCNMIAAQLLRSHKDWQEALAVKVADGEVLETPPVGPISENGYEPVPANSGEAT